MRATRGKSASTQKAPDFFGTMERSSHLDREGACFSATRTHPVNQIWRDCLMHGKRTVSNFLLSFFDTALNKDRRETGCSLSVFPSHETANVRRAASVKQ